jgi:hypothetical protein
MRAYASALDSVNHFNVSLWPLQIDGNGTNLNALGSVRKGANVNHWMNVWIASKRLNVKRDVNFFSGSGPHCRGKNCGRVEKNLIFICGILYRGFNQIFILQNFSWCNSFCAVATLQTFPYLLCYPTIPSHLARFLGSIAPVPIARRLLAIQVAHVFELP